MNKTRTFKKLLSLVMVLLMVVSTMVIMPLTASAEGEFAGVALEGVEGLGTKADPYEVDEFADLEKIKAETWEYSGEDDANEKPINNCKWGGDSIYLEFVADVAVEAGFTFSDSNKLNLYGANANTLTSWYIEGNGYTTSGWTVPMFYSTSAGYTFAFSNLTVDAAISWGERYAAPFIGTSYGTVTFTNCTARGSVYTSNTNASNTGASGFVGKINNGSLSFENCVNAANVTTDKSYAAGFLGDLPTGTATAVSFKNCINVGVITNNGAQYAAAFIARVEQTTNASFDLQMNGCINANTIATTSQYSGLIIGHYKSGGTATAQNCYSTKDYEYAEASLLKLSGTSAGRAVFSNSYTAAQIEANASAIAAINETVYTAICDNPDVAVGSGNLSIRLQLKGGYGFKLLAKLPAAEAALAEEVGFIINGDEVKGDLENGKIVVTVTDTKVVELNTEYYVAAYFKAGGQTFTSETREEAVKPLTLMSALIEDNDDVAGPDGMYNGNKVVTDAAELNVYVAMVGYYNDYTAWQAQQAEK